MIISKNDLNIESYLEEKRLLVDKYLDKYLPSEEQYPSLIHEAMRYSILSGGKRFRPILAIAVCDACNGNFEDVISTACALELIHTYSLIHDDLPSMDNDDYRRGKLSNHKKYGEDIAILAGDALLTLAFEIMDKEVVRDIAHAIGSRGVVGGQVVDIQLAKGKAALDLPLIEYIHKNKTGALIAISCKVGAVLANVANDIVKNINCFGEKIGFAFQIIDDVFDKDNYVVLKGEDGAKTRAFELIEKAKKSLTCLQEESIQNLIALADFVASREN